MTVFYETPDFEIPFRIVLCMVGAVLFFLAAFVFAFRILDVEPFKKHRHWTFLKWIPLLAIVMIALAASSVVGAAAVRDIGRIHAKKVAKNKQTYQTVCGYAVPQEMAPSKFNTYAGDFSVNGINFTATDDKDSGFAFIPLEQSGDFCSEKLTVTYTEYKGKRIIISIVGEKP